MALTKVQTEMAGTGSVLQVVNATYTGTTSTTSTSFVSTPLTVSITPKFTTSKILVLVNCSVFTVGTAYNNLTIYRNSSSNIAGTLGILGSVYNTPSSGTYGQALICQDSPATTSATTYTLYFSASAGTVYVGDSNRVNTITAMEIAA